MDVYYYLSRGTIIPVLYFLNKKKYFNAHSKYFFREMRVIIFFITFNLFCDNIVSNYTWGQCKDIITEFKNLKEEQYQNFRNKNKFANDNLLY